MVYRLATAGAATGGKDETLTGVGVGDPSRQ